MLILLLALALLVPSQQQTIVKLGEPVSVAEPKEGVADQSFLEPVNAGGNINEAYSHVGQTYVAGTTGQLTGIVIDVRSKRSLNPDQNFPSYPLHIALYTVEDLENNTPGILLAETTVEDESPLSNLITFPKAIAQIKGKKYAIIVHYLNGPAAGGGKWLGQWYGAKGSIAGGENLVGDGVTWSVPKRGREYTRRFRTYVKAI
jgi:hypothetical protein